MVLQYYHLLRSVIQDQPSRRKCLNRCRHCGIFFLTDSRNCSRQDLGCPFGCRQAHEKQSSTQRSVAYYRTDAGKKKKAALNRRRHLVYGPIPAEDKHSPAESEPGPEPEPQPDSPPKPELSPEPELAGLSEEIIEYVRMVTSLIEERPVSREAVLEMLAKILRQRRMDRRKKIDQALWQLDLKPP